jgi:serine/threonine protein kinase/WD40 repeat protein
MASQAIGGVEFVSRGNTPIPGPASGFASGSESPEARFRRVATIFERARLLGRDEREESLARDCDGDPDLLLEVRALLAHHESGVDALDGSVIRPGVGARIGRYRIEGTLGEGGMGTVYRAMQLEPVRREVALKVIKLGMDTRHVVRRFEAERQALARLEHPGVARVLDGGATPDGRPYFVMELVRGAVITAHCDERRLDWRDRVRLMVEVCAAVHHAHQRGILHRDLKPSNILVTEVDGVAVPKIIDFGVAKALDAGEGMTAASISTALGHVVGTPDYMSPEQAAGDDVDTRTDVFALGVVLFELLAGVTPVRARTATGRRTPSPLELRRRLLEDEPPRVSSAIDEDRATVRRSTAAALRRAIRGDIDWIVLKAIARDPSRRYASVAALADDLDRVLTDQPIIARPPSASYLLAKFARRHTVALVATSAVALSLVVGTAVSLFGLRTARDERDAARAAEREQFRLATALGNQLFASDVERGRKAAKQGNWSEASQLLIHAFDADPTSPHVRWAMRETAWEQGCLLTRRFDSKVRFSRFLPDGQHIFIACSAVSPIVLDVTTGTSRALTTDPGPDVWEVAVSRDGRWGFTADRFGSVMRWNLESRAEPTTLVECGSRAGGSCVACDPARDVAYAGGVDGVVWRIEYATEPPRAEPIAFGTRVKRLAIAPDGTLAVGDETGGVRLINGTERTERYIQPHTRPIQSLTFGQAGRLLATGTTGSAIVITDVETGDTVRNITTRVGTLRDLRFGPDDRTLLVLGWWGLHEINLADESIATLVPMGSWRFDLAADGNTIAMTSESYQMLSVWNIGPDRGGLRGILPIRAVPTISASTAEPVLAAMDGGVAGLDVRGRREWHVPLPSARIVIGSATGPVIGVVGSDRRLRLFDSNTKSLIATSPRANVRQDASTVDIVGDRLVAYATTDNAVELMDLKDGSRCQVAPPEDTELLGVALSDDGVWIGTCSRSDRNRLIHLPDGTESSVAASSTGFSIDFTADSRRMLVGTWRGEIMAYDVHTMEGRPLVGHSSLTKQVVAHPSDPELALSMSDDGSVRVWHLGLMREVALLRPFSQSGWNASSIRCAGWVDEGRGIGLVGSEGQMITYSIPLADQIIEQMRETPSGEIEIEDS